MELTTEKIRRARNGDEEASRDIILSALSLAKKAYRSRAQGICETDKTICLDDLLQDFALKLQEMREKWPPDHFRPWLIRVWKNFLIDRYREAVNAHRDRVDAASEEYRDDNPRLGLLMDVAKACDSLTELQRKALYCRFWQGMNYDEAAEALDITEGSYRGGISRGYERVRELLSEYELLFSGR